MKEPEYHVLGTLNGEQVAAEFRPKGMLEELWEGEELGLVTKKRKRDDWILWIGDNGISISRAVFEFLKERGSGNINR